MMNKQEQAKCQQVETRMDFHAKSSHHSVLKRTTPKHIPMERWKSEKAEEEPWNALAAFQNNTGLTERLYSQGTPSTKGQKGSVHEGTK
jgi:creatinine amidohydrolase/Fe(II)-dependent formamide hydrolase-like protein